MTDRFVPPPLTTKDEHGIEQPWAPIGSATGEVGAGR